MFAAPQDFIVILLLVIGMWLVSLWKRDAGLMDIAWGPGFVGVALWHLAQGLSHAGRSIGLLALLTLWAARLSWHIARRHPGTEDARYAAWRREAGASWWWRSLFKVFLLQGLVMWVVARPVAALLGSSNQEFTVWEGLALLLACAGLVWESVADAQLAAHRRHRPGTLCTGGLWSLHRHPNYFGEALFWWGLGLWAAAAGHPLALTSSLMMHLLLRHVSGVPLLERGMSRKEGWQEYASRTPVFWPRWGRR